MTTHHILLSGVAGSTAHGLAREGSDQDVLGLFVWPTQSFWSLQKEVSTLTGVDPDFTLHEIEKFLALALKCNPTVLELLWLDEYIVTTKWGQHLIAYREKFLSASRVLGAYLGYAESQFQKLQSRDWESFGAGGAHRAYKHARHMFRLLEQGESLYLTGDFNVRVADPQWYFDLEHKSLEEISKIFMERYDKFTENKSALPLHPDSKHFNDVLHAIREDYLA